jgi:lipoprotein-anchoring transpeptidase ErfK/SrfK
MPFNGGIGLHDASWQPWFGGNRYRTNGSHGCINMPLAAAKTLYANISIGDTVKVHY